MSIASPSPEVRRIRDAADAPFDTTHHGAHLVDAGSGATSAVAQVTVLAPLLIWADADPTAHALDPRAADWPAHRVGRTGLVLGINGTTISVPRPCSAAAIPLPTRSPTHMDYQRRGDRGAGPQGMTTLPAPIAVVAYTLLGTAAFALGLIALVEFAIPARHNDPPTARPSTLRWPCWPSSSPRPWPRSLCYVLAGTAADRPGP